MPWTWPASCRASLVCAITLLAATSTVAAPEPTYDPDPFDDSDFGVETAQPLVHGTRYDTKGRLEVGTMFALSVIDSYNSHLGLVLDLTYHPFRTLGFSLVFGFNDGSTTNIVGEVFNEKLRECGRDGVSPCPLTPDLPDLEQLTGTLDARVVWTPLYGKINLVSELDANLELYVFGGAGVHGQRRPEPVVDGNEQLGWRVDNQGVGDGGLLSDAQAHGTAGLGLKVFLNDMIALRAEVNTYVWATDFDFASGNASFLTNRYFLNTGLSFLL